MACGTPVVAADNSSLPEAVGEAGLLVDAGDSDSLAEALGGILTDSGLRSRLVQAGFEQSSRFSWQESAQQLLGVYNSFA
jgi:glycosyltransferase involved in cell wall biosynthesis